MEGRWERMGIPLVQWVAAPLFVFTFCYFVIGPLLSGGPVERSEPAADSSVEMTPAVEPEKIEPGARVWNPVSPPQVSVTVTPIEEEIPVEQYEDATPPPIIDPPDTGSADEAGIGGIVQPPVKNDDKKGDDGSLGRGMIGGDPDDDGTRSAGL